ncbi:MAG: hypothetical protein PHF18_00020 [Methanosarcina sp.]|uniref:hypothetical protein n=1 Tax=Methanosarcina sp. TaxID=2213 RepID=UPI00261076F5|nr:hypothetical protein [Methanosarcina sp.]MDD3245251.1 hypothetical protein [Methanosarcina sp.]MDD4248324.1 hypothetical protein [Methanosarcina sp.]
MLINGRTRLIEIEKYILLHLDFGGCTAVHIQSTLVNNRTMGSGTFKEKLNLFNFRLSEMIHFENVHNNTKNVFV